MKPWKKAVLVFLSMLMLMLCAAGCGQEKKQESAVREAQADTVTKEDAAVEAAPQETENQSSEEETVEHTVVDGDED